MNKVYSYETPYGTQKVTLRRETYANNNTPAVLMMTRPDEETVKYYGMTPKEAEEFSEECAVVTVNLPESILLPENTAFVDENNNPGIGEWLEANGIAELAGPQARSGFCTYKAYTFKI